MVENTFKWPSKRMNPHRIVLVVIATVCLFSGCTVIPEGIGPKAKTDREEYNEMVAQLRKNKDDAESRIKHRGDWKSPGVIAIGRVGPFRDFNNPRTFKKAYKDYAKALTGVGRAEDILSKREFKNIAGGWTTVTHEGLPQISFRVVPAFVSPSDTQIIGFSSTAGTILLGAREDLVAAISTIDFPFYIINKLLCRDGRGYSECSKNYRSGLYDVYSGRELDKKLRAKENGDTISTETFEIIRN